MHHANHDGPDPTQAPLLLLQQDQERSPRLDAALTAGETIGRVLDALVSPCLAPDERDRVRGRVAETAAKGAYAGLALWSIDALGLGDDRARSAAEAIAGVSLGLLSARPSPTVDDVSP